MQLVAPGRVRASELDRLRGAAIVCMIVDHVARALGAEPVRLTIGRLAVPVFFVLSGHLARRLTWRHAAIAATGFLLPAFVPWIDNPNVLLLYAVAAALLVLARWTGPAGPAVVAIAAVTALANGVHGMGNGYPLEALLALMVAGHYIPRAALVAIGSRLPAVFAVAGRRPVTWYVGHLLVLVYVFGVVK
ncbi:MAG: hypothetical protein BGO38_05345 [Cellulomonas sp. 73-145]|nr:MAG: hypothetical protein BGO38_05345 [Cellulomonas sp. 73-145]